MRPPEASRRRPPSVGGLPHPPAHPSNRLWSESLFNRLSRVSLFSPASIAHLGEWAEQAYMVRNPLLAGLNKYRSAAQAVAFQHLIEGLGCSSESDLELMTRSNFLTVAECAHHVPSPLLSSVLRYCPKCLAIGFHSMLYQHGGVSVCPYHRVTLLDACLACSRPWKPTFENIGRTPFCCPACGHLYFRTVLSNGCARELREASGAVSDCCHDLEVPLRASDERANTFALQNASSQLGRSAAVRRRHIQRACAWPSLPCGPWDRFREQSYSIPMAFWPRDGRSVRPLWEEVSKAPNETLQWLWLHCPVPVEQSRLLVESSWLRIQYITPLHQDRLLGAIATALHLTISKYGWQQINFRGLSHGRQRDDPYRGVSWNGTCSSSTSLCFGQISGELVAGEILGYFVLCLLRCAGLNSLAGPYAETGAAAFDPIAYCPTWIIQHEGRRWTLRFRQRTTRSLVLKLLKRYKDRPLQRMVSCTWQASHAIPDIARISAREMPQELLQFPRAVMDHTADPER